MEYEDFIKEIQPKLEKLGAVAQESTVIDNSYYDKFEVKRGLRDNHGNGVLAGLTEISDIIGRTTEPDGSRLPCEGILRYRGIDIKDIVRGFVSENRFGFEETAYLLLFGKLPTKDELSEFNYILSGLRSLPVSFIRDVIMKAPCMDMMNGLGRSVLTLYSYDDRADDISIPNVLRQCLQLIARFPLISVYSYQVFKYYHEEGGLIINTPDPKLGTAENMLHLLRHSGDYTELEAKILDMMLVLHAEHGGGNNSTFTTHVVTSSGADTYSVVAAALGSLKGPRHGGANIKVVKMFEDMKSNLPDRSDGAVRDYLRKLLNKEAFDRSGLIYGIGHAVYSLSDPRAEILRAYVQKLAVAKNRTEDFELYGKIERLAPEVIAECRTMYKGVSANVDFYSGFVNSMLGIPNELFAPIFAVSRIVGWSAHRIEELSNRGKIIRPNYEGISQVKEYMPLENRK